MIKKELKDYYGYTEYEKECFKEGEWILTEEGVYFTKSVCRCSECEYRGFYEPTLIEYLSESIPSEDYLTGWDAKGFINSIMDRSFDSDTEWVQSALSNAKALMIKESENKLNADLLMYVERFKLM